MSKRGIPAVGGEPVSLAAPIRYVIGVFPRRAGLVRLSGGLMRRISPFFPVALAFGEGVHFLRLGVSGVVVGLLVFPFAGCR